MKTFAILLAAMAIAGCDPTEGTVRSRSPEKLDLTTVASKYDVGFEVLRYETHEYLVVKSPRGISIVHSESCPCRRVKNVVADF